MRDVLYLYDYIRVLMFFASAAPFLRLSHQTATRVERNLAISRVDCDADRRLNDGLMIGLGLGQVYLCVCVCECLSTNLNTPINLKFCVSSVVIAKAKTDL